VWHFDSTPLDCGFGKKKQSALYTVASRKDSIYYPVFEFITSNHKHANITKYLNFLKDSISNTSVANLITVDFQWSHINSILKVFNKSNIEDYLIYSYAYCTKQLEKLPNTIVSNFKIYIFINSLSVTRLFISKINHLSTSISKEFCIKSFVRIQKCKNLREISEILLYLYPILNSKNYNIEIEKAQDFMKKKFNSLNINDTLFSVEDDFELNLDNNFSIVTLNSSDRFNSPFTLHFNKIFKKYESVSCDVSNNQNFFYAIEVFEVIIDFLRIAPLWTDILVCDKDPGDKHFGDDNPIETWFKITNTSATKFCQFNYANRTLNFVKSII